jgi:hypothetical protein
MKNVSAQRSKHLKLVRSILSPTCHFQDYLAQKFQRCLAQAAALILEDRAVGFLVVARRAFASRRDTVAG